MAGMNLREILNRAGTRADLARTIGVTPQAAQAWVVANKIPVKRAIAIEAATNGLIKRHELCPDVWDAPSSEAVDGD